MNNYSAREGSSYNTNYDKPATPTPKTCVFCGPVTYQNGCTHVGSAGIHTGDDVDE